MRVLFLTHRLPFAPDRGDRIRAFHILRLLKARADVELVSLVHSAAEAAQADAVRTLIPDVHILMVPKLRNYVRAVAALGGSAPMTHVLLDAPGIALQLADICYRRRPDVVLAYCSGMARFALEHPLDEFPLVLDLVDVDSRKWRDLAEASHPPLRWIYSREAARLGAFEAHAIDRAVTTCVINEREAAAARELSPSGSISIVGNGIDAQHFYPSGQQVSTARVVFCGVLDYQPNEDGAIWLARKVWPRVRAVRPDATLTLVGPNPGRRLRSACAEDPRIEITGRVPDVRDVLWRSAVAVAPLKVARGMQNKVLEAVACGLPTVVSSAVAEGLPPSVLPACDVADDAQDFADRIVTLLRLPAAGRAARAGQASFSMLTWDTVLEPLWRALMHAASRKIEHAVKN